MKNFHGVSASFGGAVLAACVAVGAFAAAESGSGTHVDLDNTAVTGFWDCREHVNPTYVWATSDAEGAGELDLRHNTSATSAAYGWIDDPFESFWRTSAESDAAPLFSGSSGSLIILR